MANTHVTARTALVLVFAALAIPGAAAEELSLSQVIDIAMQNNPSISAGRLTAQAARDFAKGAGSLSNPQIEVAPTVVGEAGADSAVLITQPLEINGSRSVRGRIAADQARVTSLEAEATARKLVLEVKESYWNLALAQAMVQLNHENIEYLDKVNTATRKQLDVGAVPGAQFIKSEVELARARQESSLAELGLAQSKSTLNMLMNRPALQELTASDALSYREEMAASVERLIDLARKTRPEVAAAQAELDAANGRTKAARLARLPDLSVQARRGSFDDSYDQGIAVGISLPVFDWGSARADLKSAAVAAQAQEKRLDAIRNGADLDVLQALQQVEASAGIVREYQSGIIKKSEQLAQMARTGYEKGATSYLELLEAQRTLRSTRTDFLTALANHSKALAKLEWASGADITKTTAEEKK